MFHKLCFWLPYICTITYRKFYLPSRNPISVKIFPNFLCHTVQKALFPNGTKSPFWSELFYLESDFKSETFKIFCGKFLMILKHINPLIDWNGPVKCQNLFWTVWHKNFKSPVKQVWGSNKSCHWWFCQWALQIHYICPTESIKQCD